MEERRQYERFMFPVPVRIETMELGRKKVLDLNTRDLSASGTFIPALTSFSEGTRFILDFTIPNNSFKNHKGIKSLKCFKGNMVRSTAYGMAIHFNL
jgi:hypothetical protein